MARTISHVPKDYATAEPGKADFYDALKVSAVMAVADGRIITPSDSNEAHHIYIQKSPHAKRLRDIEEFMDYFGNNGENWYAWEETLTGLRFREANLRKPYNIGYKITAERIETETPLNILVQIADPKFTRDNFKDIIEKINKIAGTVDIPYARGHVIEEMHDGIFTRISQSTEHREPYVLHAWLNENLEIPRDPMSGYYEVAVVRGCGWRHDVGEGCLAVAAGYWRLAADSGDGFRPVVRGPVPQEKSTA